MDVLRPLEVTEASLGMAIWMAGWDWLEMVMSLESAKRAVERRQRVRVRMRVIFIG